VASRIALLRLPWLILVAVGGPDPSAREAIVPGLRAPSGGRVLTDSPVDRFAQQVGVAGMPAILLDQVADQPAQVGVAAVGVGLMHGLVKPAVRQRRV
jgi:hypothetical protein